MLDLTDGVSGLVGQSLEAHPDQDGATDVVSLDARPAALAGLDSGELLFFAVKLLDLPAPAEPLAPPADAATRRCSRSPRLRVHGSVRRVRSVLLPAS